MENFWTDTPFGITILASLTLTMIASLCIVARNIVRVRAGDSPVNDDAWLRLAAYLLGYALVMLVVTYGAIIVYYLAGSLMGMFSVYQTLGAALGTQLWLVMQLAVSCLWLGSAALIFRRMFRRWL